MATLLSLAVLVGAWAAYARNGHVPRLAQEMARLCCTPATTLAGLPPGEQLASAPLAAFPLVDAALRAAAAKDPARARASMTAAVRRDPRLAPARFWLAQDALANNRLQEAIEHLDWLYAIDQGSRAKFVEALAGIATLPGGVAAMRGYARRNPDWRKLVVERLVAIGASPAVTYAIVKPDADPISSGGGALINGLLARRDYERAYLAWLTQLPAGSVKDVGYIYDGNFRGLPGSPPFNWAITTWGDVSTDFTRNGAHVSYFGEAPAQILQQVTVLAPGRYVLEVTAKSLSAADANPVNATMACLEQPAVPLATIRLPGSGATTRMSARFVVPAGCAAQSIAFVGTPAEFPKPAEFTILSVAIRNDAS